MKTTLKRALLAGTAIVAVISFSSPPAQAADQTLTGAGQWASAGTAGGADVGDASDASTGQTIDINNNTLLITDDGTASDVFPGPGGDLENFTLGTISDSGPAGNVNILQDAAALGALSVSIAGTDVIGIGGDFTVDNTDGVGQNVAVDVIGNLTVAGSLDITNNEATNANTVAVTVHGNLNVGTTTIAGGDFAGADASLTVGGDVTTAGLTLQNGAAGTASLVLDGGAAQAVTGTIDGSVAGDGSIVVSNTLGGVTFNDAIGGGAAIGAIDVTTATTVDFKDSVDASGGAGISMLVAGTTLTMDGASNTKTLAGDILGGAGTQTLNIDGNNDTVSGNIDMAAGDDAINITGAGVHFTGATLNGGTGTDTIDVINDAQIDNDITGVESITIDTLHTLELDGDVIGGTISVNGALSVLTFNGDAKTISADITGDVDDNTINVTGTTSTVLSGAIDMGDGVNALNISGVGVQLSGPTLAGGADADTITVTNNAEIDNDISNVETITVNVGHTLTLDGSVDATATITMNGAASALTFGGTGSKTVDATINGDGNNNTITVSGPLDNLSGDIDMGAGVNTLNLSGSGAHLSGSILTAGGGADTIAATANAQIDNDITGFETITVDASHTLEVDGTVDAGATMTMNGTGSALTFAGAGLMTVAATINGDANDNTVTVSGASKILSGVINMGAGDNVINLSGAGVHLTGATLSAGAGIADTIAATEDVQIDNAISGFESITVDAGHTLELDGNVSGGTIGVNGTGSAVTFNGDSKTISSDILGDINDNTINVTGTTLTVLSGDIDMGGGTNVLNLSGAGIHLSGATLAGGSGTDTIAITNDVQIDNDITGVEAITVSAGHLLTLDGGAAGGTITLTGNATALTINATGKTISDNISSAGEVGGNTQTVTLTAGTVSGVTTFGAGDDTLILDGGAVTNTVAFGSGADNLNLTTDGAVSANMTGLESIDVAGHVLTVSAAITGVTPTLGNGLNINNGTLIINNGGSVAGNIYDSNGAGNGDLVFGDDTFGGTFDLGGTVNDAALTVTSGTLSTNGHQMGANQLLGAITLGAPAAIFNVQNNVSSGGALLNHGTVAVSDAKVLTVDSYDATSDGTLSFEINKTGGVRTNGSLVISGGGVFDLTDNTVAITQKANSQLVFDGEVFHLETGAGSILGIGTVAENSYIYDYVLSNPGAGDLDMTVTQASSMAAATTSSNNLNVANTMLTALAGNLDPGIVAAQTMLAGASTRQQFNDYLEALLPALDGGAEEGAMDIAAETQDIADTRIAALHTGGGMSGMAAGDSSNGVSMWAQGYGRVAKQDARSSIDGYDSKLRGGAVGMDTTGLFEDGVAGFMINYGLARVESRNANTTTTDVKNFGLNVFGSADLGQWMFLNGQGGYARSTINSDRHDVGGVAGATANGDYHSDTWTAKMELGGDMESSYVTLTPVLSAAYTHITTGSYTETCVTIPCASLNVESADRSALNLGLGGTLSWRLRNADGAMMKPALHAGYTYDVLGDRINETSSFVGDPLGTTFTSEGNSPARNIFNGGAGLTYLSAANWDLAAVYDFKFRQDYISHSGLLRATTHF